VQELLEVFWWSVLSKCLLDCFGCYDGGFVWCDGGDQVNMMEKLNSFGDAFCIGGVDVASMASVVFHHWADVPSLLSVWVPACPLSWLFVDDDFCSRCHEWVLIVVVSAKNYFVG
jgi:hypothetical protein